MMRSTEIVAGVQKQAAPTVPATERRAQTLDGALTRAVRGAVVQEIERLRAVLRDEFARAQVVRRNDPDEILTVEQAATEAKCSPRTIAAACKAKKIDAQKPPGLSEWRVTRAALLRWARADGTVSAGNAATSALDIDSKARNAAGRLLDLADGTTRRNK